MNDRIKELYEQSLNKFPHAPKLDPERFVALVIEESIEVMKQHDYHGEWLGEKLKKHFGIPFDSKYNE